MSAKTVTQMFDTHMINLDYRQELKTGRDSFTGVDIQRYSVAGDLSYDGPIGPYEQVQSMTATFMR